MGWEWRYGLGMEILVALVTFNLFCRGSKTVKKSDLSANISFLSGKVLRIAYSDL